MQIKEALIILGISEEDLKDLAKVKKGFRKKMFQVHPDRNNGDDTKSKELNVAMTTVEDFIKGKHDDLGSIMVAWQVINDCVMTIVDGKRVIIWPADLAGRAFATPQDHFIDLVLGGSVCIDTPLGVGEFSLPRNGKIVVFAGFDSMRAWVPMEVILGGELTLSKLTNYSEVNFHFCDPRKNPDISTALRIDFEMFSRFLEIYKTTVVYSYFKIGV